MLDFLPEASIGITLKFCLISFLNHNTDYFQSYIKILKKASQVLKWLPGYTADKIQMIIPILH